jgi:hypothetical protein
MHARVRKWKGNQKSRSVYGGETQSLILRRKIDPSLRENSGKKFPQLDLRNCSTLCRSLAATPSMRMRKLSATIALKIAWIFWFISSLRSRFIYQIRNYDWTLSLEMLEPYGLILAAAKTPNISKARRRSGHAKSEFLETALIHSITKDRRPCAFLCFRHGCS